MTRMRIDTLKSAVEAAGVTMAPSPDEFDADPSEMADVSPASHVRSWTQTLDPTAAKLKGWFAVRWPRALSAG